ncbi:MAG: hypothetical protein SOT58_11170, partial [Agathobacter sp.]|nr:hypothetical protein [Agathobacter sp.]
RFSKLLFGLSFKGIFSQYSDFLWRVSGVRFSKCSDLGGLSLTQPLEIRHPWLSSRSRQRPVAELLGSVQNIKKI